MTGFYYLNALQCKFYSAHHKLTLQQEPAPLQPQLRVLPLP